MPIPGPLAARPVLVVAALMTLAACSGTASPDSASGGTFGSRPGAGNGSASSGSASSISPPPAAGTVADCGTVSVAILAGGSPEPALVRGVSCFAGAVRGCRAARLVVTEKGVDTVRRSELSLTPASGCAVSVLQTLVIQPLPARQLTFHCVRVQQLSSGLRLSQCSDGREHMVPQSA